MRWQIVSVLLAVSLLPVVIMGAGSWIVFGGLLESKALQLQHSVVQAHAQAVDGFLREQVDLLRLMAQTHPRDELVRHALLQDLFIALDQVSSGSFVDLGVIDHNGNHLAYTGPYDLLNANYRDQEWFREVMEQGEYVSDVFPGFRNVPHCIIAVKVTNGGQPWILRSTINSDKFDALVRTVALGESGEVWLVDREGHFQSETPSGNVLDVAPLPDLTPHPGVADSRLKIDEREMALVTTWINDGRWMLAALQDAAEVREPLRKALWNGALVVSVCVLLIIVTTIFATWRLTNRIDRANSEREDMQRAFIRSAKLASVGELATGLAHEINNPLAIISAEQTNIADLIDLNCKADPWCEEIIQSVQRIKKQVKRCAGITSRMLQFGRNTISTPQPSNLHAKLTEIQDMMQRQADVRNIALDLDIRGSLPEVMIDPLELEQVMLNLLTNAFHAMPDGGKITLSAEIQDRFVCLDVADTGRGMPPEVAERIFEPFFTTKPVGEGTGLGLSVCYGIVQSWGGTIRVDSQEGQGTTMKLFLPVVQEQPATIAGGVQ